MIPVKALSTSATGEPFIGQDGHTAGFAGIFPLKNSCVTAFLEDNSAFVSYILLCFD